MDRGTAESTLRFAEEASADATGRHAKDALERLEARLDELLEAMDWFIEEGRPDEAIRLANALYRFWITKQRFAEGATAFDRVLAAPGGDDLLRGKAALSAGMMPFWMGDDTHASELFEEALETGRRLGDAPLTSQALGGLARVALRTDVPEARRLAAEALAVSDAANDEGGRSNALHLLGVGAQLAGDLLEARAWMTQRLKLVRRTDNQFLIASEAANLSMVNASSATSTPLRRWLARHSRSRLGPATSSRRPSRSAGWRRSRRSAASWCARRHSSARRSRSWRRRGWPGRPTSDRTTSAS
jgi:tetratricopeptide (TPR) repeat protein